MSKNRTLIMARVGVETQAKIKEVAMALGYKYAKDGSIGKLLDAIADGEIILIKREKGG